MPLIPVLEGENSVTEIVSGIESWEEEQREKILFWTLHEDEMLSSVGLWCSFHQCKYSSGSQSLKPKAKPKKIWKKGINILYFAREGILEIRDHQKKHASINPITVVSWEQDLVS